MQGSTAPPQQQGHTALVDPAGSSRVKQLHSSSGGVRHRVARREAGGKWEVPLRTWAVAARDAQLGDHAERLESRLRHALGTLATTAALGSHRTLRMFAHLPIC